MPYVDPGQTHAWCKLGEHEALVDDFDGRWRETPNGSVWHIDPSCRFHKESKRHEDKHADLAWHILKSRAGNLARRTGTTLHFVLHDPRGPCWIRLLPLLKAFLAQHADEDANCTSCGKRFSRETRDVQLDHIHPPRELPNGEPDWARHCARNIRILCGSCNNGKSQKPDDVWIDEQYRWQCLDVNRAEEQRLAIQQQAPPPKLCGCPPEGMCLFCYRDESEGTSDVRFAAWPGVISTPVLLQVGHIRLA